jgi:hypothetical protein
MKSMNCLGTRRMPEGGRMRLKVAGKEGSGQNQMCWLTFAVRIPRSVRYAASLAEQALQPRHSRSHTATST